MTAYDLAPLDDTICQKIHFKFDVNTRILSLVVPTGTKPDRWASTTVDANGTLLILDNPPDGFDDMWFEFAVSVVRPDHTTFRPRGPLIRDRLTDERYYLLENYVVAAAFKLRKLPVQLMMRKQDTVICSRTTISLEVSRGINALGTIRENYSDLMFKTDTWDFSETRIYHKGSVVTYGNEIWISTVDNNVANIPSRKSMFWRLPGDENNMKFKPVSISFECTEAGQETHWEIDHGLNTRNFVWSIRQEGTNECPYCYALVTAVNRDKLTIDFSNPVVGKYVINIIPCKETTAYRQHIDTVHEITDHIEFVSQIYLPRYVQTYDTTITETAKPNEMIPLIMQNPEEGYNRTDVYFWNGETTATKDVNAIFISPDDTMVHYFTNTGSTEPIEIAKNTGLRYMIQMFDTETDERVFGEVYQDISKITIKLNMDRSICVMLIECTEVIPFPDDEDWTYQIGTGSGHKYDGPVAVQCIDKDGNVMFPSLFVSDTNIAARFGERMSGYMMICGKEAD